MTGKIEYQMPRAFMKELLKNKKDKKKSNQQYLCEYVDNEIRPLGKTVKVVGC